MPASVHVVQEIWGWLAVRRREALRIEPETAEVIWR
jgi:hypothetical protein